MIFFVFCFEDFFFPTRTKTGLDLSSLFALFLDISDYPFCLLDYGEWPNAEWPLFYWVNLYYFKKKINTNLTFYPPKVQN